VTAKLWEVIRALLSRNIVLANTDHLSDRELYTLLWNETLREESVISPTNTLHLDMTRTGIDDGMPIYLRYYASEEQREMYSDCTRSSKCPRMSNHLSAGIISFRRAVPTPEMLRS
jgi:hypothetical protein